MEKDNWEIPSFVNQKKPKEEVTVTIENINRKVYKEKMKYAVQKNEHNKTKLTYISKSFLERIKNQ